MAVIENRIFDEIEVGDEACVERTLSIKDIRLFAALTGDVNPLHFDKEFAQDSIFQKIIAHGMWAGSLISSVLGTLLPGPGTIYLSQNFEFRRPIVAGEKILTTVKVAEKHDEGHRLVMDCECRTEGGEIAIYGQATVIAPTEKVRRERVGSSSLALHQAGARLESLIDSAKKAGRLTMAIIHPVDRPSLSGALQAADRGLVEPVLVGPETRIKAAAEEANLDISQFEIVATEHSHAAAERAVELVREGRVASLMKGALHTDEVLAPVLDSATGLRTERRVSHVFVMDVPSYERLLLITDGAVNVAPDIDVLADITQNAIDLAHAIGVAEPAVALLSAVETVTPKLPSTVICAALCKMADRGQITGGVLDGPLAFDNAVSEQAARIKGIRSKVAGRADILVVPDLEAGNMLAKQLDYLAGAEGAGIVLGARVPIALTSRADTPLERVASAALAVLMANRRRSDDGVVS